MSTIRKCGANLKKTRKSICDRHTYSGAHNRGEQKYLEPISVILLISHVSRLFFNFIEEDAQLVFLHFF